MRHLSLRIAITAAILGMVLVSEPLGATPAGQVPEQTDGDGYRIHTAKPGETLYSLSRMYGVTIDEIVELNGLDNGLKTGAVIRIPTKGTVGEDRADRGQTPRTPDGPREGDTADNARSDDDMMPDRWGDGFGPDNGNAIPNIALMLPLSGTGSGMFADFYKGALLAFEDMKSEGHSLDVTLYNSDRSANKVSDIVSTQEFSGTDLIIGPIYEDEMRPALQFAELAGVPIVSPLDVAKTLDSDLLYQMAPDPGAKYDKLRPLLQSDANVIVISSGTGNDAEFEREITAEIGAGNYGRFSVGGSGGIASLIDWERKNVLVVLAGTQLGVDGALAAISSSYTNASARRSSRRADITVVGSSKWGSYNIDRNLFFKLNVQFVTSYYIDHSNETVARFESRYLEAYGKFPSRYAFRGYDAASLFAGALFEYGYSFDEKLTGKLMKTGATPLETPYGFIRRDGYMRRVNDQWALVSFSGDYNVTIR